jgi:branched-subunit amino acid aminotransferase/4-amino-4-deoxychorismate lyase
MLSLQSPLAKEQTLTEWALQLGAVSSQYYRAKWLVWRAGKAPFTPETSEIEQLFFMVETTKPKVQNLKHAGLCESVQVGLHAWSAAKTLNALPYVMASAEKQQRKLDELVMLNQQGMLAECTSSNLFWGKDGHLFTPSLASGCQAGVMRGQVIELCKTLEISCTEGLFAPEVLHEADSIFCTNVTQLGIFTHWQGAELKPMNQLIMAPLSSLW